MIKDVKKVKEYMKFGEFIFTSPRWEEFYSKVPYGHYGDTSTPFIEVYKMENLLELSMPVRLQKFDFLTHNPKHNGWRFLPVRFASVRIADLPRD